MYQRVKGTYLANRLVPQPAWGTGGRPSMYLSHSLVSNLIFPSYPGVQGGRKGGGWGEGNISGYLLHRHTHRDWGSSPKTEACALTWNPTGNLSVHGTMPSQQPHWSVLSLTAKLLVADGSKREFRLICRPPLLPATFIFRPFLGSSSSKRLLS